MKVDLLLGAAIALAVILVASLAQSFLILVAVPALGAVSLVLSWSWQNRIFRGFALTLVGITLSAFAAYWLAYLPHILGSWFAS